jgi:hypothetical protein
MGLFSKKIPKVSYSCPVQWEMLDGNDSVRHCKECNSNVFNLLGLDDEEIRQFVELHDGKVCGLVKTKRDGLVINGKCKKPQSIRMGIITNIEPTKEQIVERKIDMAMKRIENLTKLKKLINKVKRVKQT